MPLSGHKIAAQKRGSSPGSGGSNLDGAGSGGSPFSDGGSTRALPSPVLEYYTDDPLPHSEGWEGGRESWGRKAMHVAPSGQEEVSQGLHYCV